MTDTQNKNMSADEISIGDLIEKLWRKRGLIVFLPLLLAGLTAVGVLYNKSTHSIVGGIYTNGMVFPYAVANLLVLMGLAVAALIRWLRRLKNRPQFDLRLLATALCLCLYGLAFDDILRWHWQVEHLINTQKRYAGVPLEKCIRNDDFRCARFSGDCAAHF